MKHFEILQALKFICFRHVQALGLPPCHPDDVLFKIKREYRDEAAHNMVDLASLDTVREIEVTTPK